jgi:hypothetical protein
MLKKILTGATAALTLGGAVLTAATPAAAQHWRGGFHGGFRGHHSNAGAVIGAGVLGLALGASLAGPRYYGPPAYYGPDYGYYYGGCRRHMRWDPYWRRYVEVERCY